MSKNTHNAYYKYECTMDQELLRELLQADAVGMSD